jgi:nucleoside-diphosphate-sugar epimerase
MTQRHLFCFGLGYSSQAIARRALASGWKVSGSCRSEQKAEALKRAGMVAYVFDDDRLLQSIEQALNGVTHLISSVPPANQGDPVLVAHGSDLAAIGKRWDWIGYLSTIGVYGDQQGRWIDETCPPNPQSPSSKRRLQAENDWLALGQGLQLPTHLFRLPGIYGPGPRNQLTALKAGRARRIVKPGQVFNRIHVDDLARVVFASMQKPGGSPIYNVTDDEPAPSDQVVAYAAGLLGIEPPPEEAFASAELSPFARHFYAECKRVRNDRIKHQLGVELDYPTYRQGLAAIAATGVEV